MLLKMDYFPENFPPSLGSSLSRQQTLNFSLARLMWSAMTVGRDSWNKVVQSGMYSAFEIIYRSSLLLANLEMSPGKKIAQSAAYKNLDPSEKSSVSYFIGLTCTKLLAQKLFGVTWLMHLDVYRDNYDMQFGVGASRPDLIGIDNAGRWFAFESKGRTRNISGDTKAKAKQQVNQLSSINNQPIYLGIGSISYFNSGDKLAVFLKDPPIEKGQSFNFDSKEFWKNYYRLFIDMIDSEYGRRERIKNGSRSYFVKYFVEMDNHIGIDEEIYTYFKENQATEDLAKVLGLLPKSSEESNDPTTPWTGEDGIYLAIGKQWASRFEEKTKY